MVAWQSQILSTIYKRATWLSKTCWWSSITFSRKRSRRRQARLQIENVVPKPSKHQLCRPTKPAFDVRVLRGVRWKRDDGKPGVAFFGLTEPDRNDDSQSATVWAVDCSCAGDDLRTCPTILASIKACDIYGAAAIRRVRPHGQRR